MFTVLQSCLFTLRGYYFHEQYSGGLKRWQHTTHQTDDNQMILHTNLEIFFSPREYITVVLYFMTLHWCAYKMCNTPE